MRRLRRVRPVVILAALILLTWTVAAHPWGWLYGLGVHPYPASSGTPWTYQLWSGLIPALTVVTLLGSVASLYKLHVCHEDGCWHLGRHKINGASWCDRHHEKARPETSENQLLASLLEELVSIRGLLEEMTSR